MKVLILGVNGFIGHHLTARLLRDTDWTVFGMDLSAERLGDSVDHHRFEFADRLTVAAVTLPPAELLLSKLQVVKINRKDVLDALALLADYPLADGDEAGDAISLRRITGLTSNDWGWWRTITNNLDNLQTIADADLQPGELEFGRPPRFRPSAQIAALREAVDGAPKSTKWKLRARVGDRMVWYEEPEEVEHGRG